MGRVTSPHPSALEGSSNPGARQLARGITATWWYTVTGVVFIELMIVMLWAMNLLLAEAGAAEFLIVGIGGLLWCASTMVLLTDYRNRFDAEPGVPWRRLILPLAASIAYGVAGGLITGSWVLGAMPLAQVLILLNWPRGTRLRVLLAITAALVCLWMIDGGFSFNAGTTELDRSSWVLLAVLALMMPSITVTSLWLWDVLSTIDRARASEARLAATQERLRLATDVHDLQGHHLQVIALQLELAERLLPSDPEAGMEQLRAARASVDEARQGTRDLATRFRSVPLRDELANARDLLRAAGLDAEAVIGGDADHAPASDLGPVIRETTTNVLRHGGGARARLSLAAVPGGWRYEISNDVLPGAAESRDGSGLDGIRRRIGEAGGTLEVRRDGDDFVVVVTVPAAEEQR